MTAPDEKRRMQELIDRFVAEFGDDLDTLGHATLVGFLVRVGLENGLTTDRFHRVIDRVAEALARAEILN